MREFFLSALLLVIGTGQALAYPRPDAVRFELDRGANSGPKMQLGSNLIYGKTQVLKCQFDFSKQGGTAAAYKLKTWDGTNCVIPGKAVVTNATLDVLTSGADASSGSTIAIGTGQSASDLLIATLTTTYAGGSVYAATISSSTQVKISAAASGAGVNPILTITGTITALKVNVYIHYVIGE